MTEVYMGQIMMTGFGYAPRGFAQCNGQLMSIQQNQALFSLLSVTYGGNGQVTFGLPNLQGRAPTGGGRNYALGMPNGVETVTLLPGEMPQHTHMMAVDTALATAPASLNGVLAGAKATGGGPENLYAAATGTDMVPLSTTLLDPYGGGQAHANMQPYAVINFNIALQGVFPSRG